VSILLLAAVVLGSPATTKAAELEAVSTDGLPRRLVLALDGIPFDVFTEVQQRGHFTEFVPARRMVAPFPSLTDVSFSTIAGSGPPVGFQAMHFDPERNRVVGNSLRSMSGAAHRHLPANTKPRSWIGRALGYLTPYRSALRQLRGMRRDFLASDRETFVAYVEATDWLLHVEGRTRADRFLVELDAALAALQQEVVVRTGRRLMVDIVSDHGSTAGAGRPARLSRALQHCGLRRARRLGAPDAVAYTQAGIIGSVAISCDPTRSEQVARCLLAEEGVDLTAFTRDGAVVALSRNGEAEIRLVPAGTETYSYRPIQGDPLRLQEPMSGGADGGTIVAPATTWFRRTRDAPYPDPASRLWFAFHGAVRKPPEVLVSLADRWESANRWVRAVARLRGRHGTHGSLTRAASLGMITSNWRNVDDTDAEGAHELLFSPSAFRLARAVTDPARFVARTSRPASGGLRSGRPPGS
jgi:hypothetical protein